MPPSRITKVAPPDLVRMRAPILYIDAVEVQLFDESIQNDIGFFESAGNAVSLGSVVKVDAFRLEVVRRATGAYKVERGPY